MSGNAAIFGGGIYHHGGTFTLNDSTVSGNTAILGGGILNGGGGIFNAGILTLTGSSSVSANIPDNIVP